MMINEGTQPEANLSLTDLKQILLTSEMGSAHWQRAVTVTLLRLLEGQLDTDRQWAEAYWGDDE